MTAEEKTKHLEIIQGVINRLANNSFLIKGWMITVSLAGFSLFINQKEMPLLGTVSFIVILFWVLDAYYLRQERLFRELYNSVRKTKRKEIDPYSFDTNSVNGKVKNWFCTLFSPTVILLHGSVILFIVIFIIIIKGGF